MAIDARVSWIRYVAPQIKAPISKSAVAEGIGNVAPRPDGLAHRTPFTRTRQTPFRPRHGAQAGDGPSSILIVGHQMLLAWLILTVGTATLLFGSYGVRMHVRSVYRP